MKREKKLELLKTQRKERKQQEKDKKKQTPKLSEKDITSPETDDLSISIKTISWKGMAILVLIILFLIAGSYLLYIIHPFLGGALLTVGVSLLFGVGRKDVRKFLFPDKT